MHSIAQPAGNFTDKKLWWFFPCPFGWSVQFKMFFFCPSSANLHTFYTSAPKPHQWYFEVNVQLKSIFEKKWLLSNALVTNLMSLLALDFAKNKQGCKNNM